jgi:hypothetical protein
MPFSTPLSQWLSQYRTFVNTDNLLSSDQAGRSLGPASGVLGDLYPFLNPNAFVGLFAGLSIAGFDATAGEIRLVKYRSRTGFQPVENGPFSGTGWQNMTGEDWCRLDPTIYPPPTGSEAPSIHAVDLEFLVGDTLMDTQNGQYRSRRLSEDYQLHFWWRPHTYSVTAVTFLTAHETLAPFLRPSHVTDDSAILDPACLFPASRTARLFGGLCVLTTGEHIDVNVADPVPATADNPLDTQPAQTRGTTVILSRGRLAKEQAIRSLSGARPNTIGGIRFHSTGLHRLTQPYEEIDTERGLVKLTPHVLRIQSHDQPCCSCEDYADAWNKISELFTEQAALIAEYNALFLHIKQLRDATETLFCDLTQPIRARRDSVTTGPADGTSVWQVDFTIFVTNSRENTVKYPASSFQLVSENDTPRLLEVSVQKAPGNMNFQVTDIQETGFQVDEISVPPFSRKAVRLCLDVACPECPGDLKLLWQPET